MEDSSCLSIKVPNTLPLHKTQLSNGVGWYRIRLFIPEDLKTLKQPAIFLGRIADADEVFFNGIKIGGEGKIGKNFIEASKVSRLYKIPSDLIYFGKENFLAIRVMNTWLAGGFLEKGPVIGEYIELLPIKLFQENHLKYEEICILSIYGVCFLFWLFFYLRGIRDLEYVAFGPVVLNMAIVSFLDSLFFYQMGFKTVLIQKLIFFLLAILPANLIFFLVNAYKINFSWKYYLVVAFFFLLTPGILWPDYQIYTTCVLLWLCAVSFCMLIMLYSSIYAIRRQIPEARPLMVGVFCLALATLGGGISFFMSLYTNVYIEEFAFITFLFSVMYALVERHFRFIKKIKFLSASLLEAQEGERKRLSRELHDGVAQQLVTLKLNLEMIRAREKQGKTFGGNILDSLIFETQKVINELRGVVLCLRPSFLEKRSLDEVLREYSQKLTKQTGLNIYLQASFPINADIRIKDNLFRIYQEAMANIVKHARASAVSIRLEKKDRFIYLEIEDNGCGFKREDLAKNPGIGLSSIQERVDSLGGSFTIESQPGKGTKLKIKVPEKI